MVVLLPTHAIENDKLENPLEATRRSTRYHAYRRKVIVSTALFRLQIRILRVLLLYVHRLLFVRFTLD